ncbi:zinc finger protein Xfin-like [Plodia interpunctella]|uniref:zinc finger protein Xfin-like n=1 Tax=Plodia interpunctella TaxID=58824 RepID=UPI0023686B3D|nr:zinc finger protein Xfin-like [Plodia interpunctella]
MSVNYDSVCRLCLSSRDELLPIFPTTSSDDSEPPVLARKIKDCVSVQISKNDELPTNVCRKCMNNVNNWHIFKSVCERTQNKLESLIKKDGNQLEEVKIKSEPFSDEAYEDGVVIDGSYPDSENVGGSSKIQPEGPPILASLGLTPRSDKGMESDKEEEEEDEEMNESSQSFSTVPAPAIPEVSITVMRPSGETLPARQGIQALASKECLVCGRAYRYSHNARRHELTAHSFDRYTNKVSHKKKPFSHMQPKLRPNPFNPKARLMPSHKMHLIPKPVPKLMPVRNANPPKPVLIKKGPQNNLPYPLRIKALKDLQIKKKEPQMLKTLLTSKPEILTSEIDIANSEPESPETLVSEPEIASFQVETILSEPDAFDQPQGEEDGEGEVEGNNQNQNYDTVDMDSENEIEIARQQDNEPEEDDHNPDNDNEDNLNQDEEHNADEAHSETEKEQNEENLEQDEIMDKENFENKAEIEGDIKEMDEEEDREHDDQEVNHDENEEDDDMPPMAPVVEINEDMQTNSYNSEMNEEEEELDETADDTADLNETEEEPVKELDPDKVYVTKTQRDFIVKYRDIIQQINTKVCLCCDREHPRRKAVIQHLQKNGHKVPKHTCYNCVVTFSHIGALLSHMRSNTCTDLWKIIYNENGITDDIVIDDEPKEAKVQYKDIFNARSYACKLCPAKFQLKQFIMKHVLDVHEDGQSRVPMICVHCRTRFKDKSLIKKHIRNGDCTVYISCDLCSEKFSNMQTFNDHAMAVHAGNFDQADNPSKCVDGRPTDCPICGKKNSGYPNLVKHLKIIHNEEKPHYCTHCDERFEQAADLNQHIYTVHSDRGMTEPDMSLVKEEAEEYHYSCTECNAIFETVDAWTDHQVAEHNQVAHHCDQCDKKFLRPSELAEHKNTHLRVKFYPCNICSNSYSTPQKLTEHVQQAHPGAGSGGGSQTTDNEFFCDICIRSFKSRQAYSNHMRIHSRVPTPNRKPGDPKGFSPQIIGKPIKQFPSIQANFVYKPNCNVPNAPYSCDICGKGFMHKKNIWKHKKVLHADILNDRNDSEENTMQASTEEDEYNVDENGALLSTPQFNSFNFANFANNVQQTPQEDQLLYTCELCFKRFPLRSSLWKHKRAKHGIINASAGGEVATPSSAGPSEGSSRSSCTICKITFSDKKSYYRHRKNVHKTATQMCKICGKPLNSTLELYEHLKAAHARELLGYNASQGSSTKQEMKQELEVDYENDQDSIDPTVDYQARYPCDTCGKQFVGLLALQNHQCINQVQSQPQTFDCEICHKSYTSIAALKSHRGWHLRSPDGKAAANNTGLWMPQNKVTNKVSKHEVVDPVQLARVQHTTVSSPAAAVAAKRRLPPEVEVTVVNPNKKLRSDDSIDLEQQTGSMEDRYCTLCDKEFTKRAAYQRHMEEVHMPNSVFCPVCDKSFTRKSTLIVHMKKHYEGGQGSSSGTQMEEDCACEVCGVQFESEAALRAHAARHHGEEESEESEEEGGAAPLQPGEFTCAQCGDGVATPRDLIAHRTMHATPTKFFCNICKVYFVRALDLSSHTRARHADNEKVFFPCAMCDRFYMNKKSLQRHIETAH